MHPTQTVPRLVGPGRRGASAGIQRTLLPCSARKQSPAGKWFCRLAGIAGAARGWGWGGCGAEIQRTLLPMLPTQTVHRLVWPSAARARGQCWYTTDIAPHAPYANSPPAGLAVFGAGAGPVLGYNGICSPCTLRKQSPCWFGLVRRGASAGMQRHLLPYSLRKQSPAGRWFCRHVWLGRGGAGLGQERRGDTTYFAPLLPTQTVSRLGGGFAAMSGWAGVVRRGRGASAGIQRTLLPMHPTQTVPGRLAGAARCGAGAGIQRHLLPMFPTQTVHRLIWPSAARARGWGGDTTAFAPYVPYANSPPADLAECGAGAGLGRGYNGHCSLAPYPNSLPAGRWFCRHVWLGQGGAARARGQCWDTTDIAPYARYANSPRLVGPSAARVRGWGGNATYFAPHAPYANSPHAGLARCGASAGIQRTLLPCSARKQSPGWEVVLPLGWYIRGGAGLGRVRSGDTTDIAPYAPYANSPHAGLTRCGAGAGLGRGYNGICSPCTLRKQSPADLAECGAGAGLGRGYNGHCSPCSLRKQSTG